MNKVINSQTKKQKCPAKLGPSIAENLVDEFHIAPLGQTPKSTLLVIANLVYLHSAYSVVVP